MANFEEFKTEIAKAYSVSEYELVSEIEIILNHKNLLVERLGGHVAFWDVFIPNLEVEFQLTRDLPMSRMREKQLVMESLQGCDVEFMSCEEHTRLTSELMNVLNGSATTLANNRVKGGRASRKITQEKIKEIKERLTELIKLHPLRLKTAHIDTLVEEFKLSKTSIKSILPKKVKH